MEQFNDPEFSVIALTAALNNVPFVPGQVGATGIFGEEQIAELVVKIAEENGMLELVEPTPRGAPGITIGGDPRRMVPFAVDHYEINDAVMADEVQGVRAFGTDASALETVMGRIDQKLARAARDLDNTLEHQRVGAIKGIVLARSGKVLHNLYTDFGIAMPAPITLGLGADVPKLASRLKGDITLALEDELDTTYTGIHAMCGADFHAALYDQKEVRETYLNHVGAEALRLDVPDVFSFAGITWERYRTGRRAIAANGGSAYIAPNEARIFPKGVPDLFKTFFGPADWNETVNTLGLPRYAKQWAMANGKGHHLDSQMNALSICTRPSCLRRVTI